MTTAIRRLAGALLLGISACGTITYVDPGTAQVRFFHGAPGLGSVDVQVAGLTVHGLGYGTLSSPSATAAGSSTVLVRSGASIVVSRAITLPVGSRLTITLLAQGATTTLSTATDTGSFQPGRANIRVISAPEQPRTVADSSLSPQSELDVYLTRDDPGVASASPVLRIETQVLSYSPYFQVDPGNLIVTFTRRGTRTVVAQTELIPVGGSQGKAIIIQRASDGSYRLRADDVSEQP